MALQNYKERRIGCHVVLKASEKQVSQILLSVKGAILEFPIGSKHFHPSGVSIVREEENVYILRGFEKWEDVNQLKLPSDLLALSEYILENELYQTLSFRHEEDGLKEEITL